VARVDTWRKRGVVVAVSPADPEALSFSLIATGGAWRKEKITRIREQLRQGTYHISAAEVAKAILRSEPSLESVKRRYPRPVLMSITVPACSVRRH
jgi:anti-sigma28 factor (negative regulator of flagellin synthesis)